MPASASPHLMNPNLCLPEMNSDRTHRHSRDGSSSWVDALRAGDPLLGTFIQIPSAPLVEIISTTGLDFVIIDLEHGEYGISEVPALVRAADVGGLFTIVRTATNAPSTIGKALDFGADAVLVPHIGSGEEAAAAVAAAKYPPQGRRGAYPLMRAARYGRDHGEGWEAAENERTSVFLMIEGREAVEKLSEILETPGIGGVFVGPMDLSHSLGVQGEVGHPRVEALARKVVRAADEAGVPASIFCPTLEDAAKYADAGFSLIAYAVDSHILSAGYSAANRAFRAGRL